MPPPRGRLCRRPPGVVLHRRAGGFHGRRTDSRGSNLRRGIREAPARPEAPRHRIMSPPTMPRPPTNTPSPAPEPLVPSRFTYAGLFTAALSTLMFEVLLTRIFSVTMFYHFAFVAISVAMFGMSAGAMAVYLLPNTFTPRRLKAHLAVATLLFALTSLGAFLLHVSLPTFSSGQTSG